MNAICETCRRAFNGLGPTCQHCQGEQPKPVPGWGPPTWELVQHDARRAGLSEAVLRDMEARDMLGRVRYGEPLRAHNGRDSLRDAYEEALDLCAYLRQAISEETSGSRGAALATLYQEALAVAGRLGGLVRR